jgi:hypothetical protein
MVYSAIGTRWGFYSLAQAVSADGYSWERGPPNRCPSHPCPALI